VSAAAGGEIPYSWFIYSYLFCVNRILREIAESCSNHAINYKTTKRWNRAHQKLENTSQYNNVRYPSVEHILSTP